MQLLQHVLAVVADSNQVQVAGTVSGQGGWRGIRGYRFSVGLDSVMRCIGVSNHVKGGREVVMKAVVVAEM